MNFSAAVSSLSNSAVCPIVVGKAARLCGEIMIEKWMAIALLKGLARSLLLTELLELAAATCFPQRNKRDFLLVFLVNVITNPVVVYLDYWFRFRMPSVVLWIAILEFGVWLSEAWIYRNCLTGRQNPFLYSLALNAASYFGGMIYNWVL